MVFRSKIDRFFVVFIMILVLIIGVSTFFPLALEDGTDLSVVITLTSTFLIIASFVLWCVFSVKYVFYDDYLFVKGGPFRSRISYQDITKISPTSEIFTGYRLLSSRDALEVFYKTGAFGSVKISPRDKKEFLTELSKRCPNIQIQE
ncbi:PH domain-containing protein [Bacillus alkalicellulosilyticus]|uniref:PH domain-containing protein n=1 Tax=Alkalihalobacterium alkalicellulosilyticum TaxID=1912214 RepID=UPI000996A229|nr:PH domain-containing protein [Bacillus alkalicellulosilyticus]